MNGADPSQPTPRRSISSLTTLWRCLVATVTRWFKQPDDISRKKWIGLLGTLFVDGICAVVLACLEFYMAATFVGTLAAGTMLAIGIANWWAIYSALRAAHSWKREAVIAQVLVLFLTGYIILTDWRSPGVSWSVLVIAVFFFIVGFLWIVFLGGGAKVEWTKSGVIITALFPLAALLQFWLQTYYVPATSKPLVDISSDLSLQSQTGPIMHLAAKVTVHNRGAGSVKVADALMRVTAYPRTPQQQGPRAECVDTYGLKPFCQLASGLDLGGGNIDTDFRVNPTPPTSSELLYASDFMSGRGTFLSAGATETFQRIVDIDPANVRLARLSVSAVFLTDRKIKETRWCGGGDPLSPSVFAAKTHDNPEGRIDRPPKDKLGHEFCLEYEIAPKNIIEKWIGNRPVLRVFMILDDPLDPGNEYPQIDYTYNAANGFDKPDTGQRESRKIEEANPTAAYLDVSAEYAPADP